MILETAYLTIDPARAEEFAAAVHDCATLFRNARGCHGMRLERQIEDPSRYLLRVIWDTIEDHMVGFRDSPEFQQWRAKAGPFFIAAAVVVHSQDVGIGF